MPIEANTLSYFQELEALKLLDEEQSCAFLDLLVLAILADAEITEEELEQFDEEILRLPFLWDEDARERVVAHSATTREFLENNIGDDQKIEVFVADLADKIETEDHRLVAMRMFTALVLADGITDVERERVFDVGRAFGFESDRIDAIISEVRDA